MRPHVILRYIGFVMLLNAAFILLSYFIALYNNDSGQQPLLYTFLITTLMGLFPLVFVPKTLNLSNKEAYFVVVLSWIISCFVGMLPLLLWGGEFTFIRAFFESVSGYTTTGATILTDIEALPNSLLFWRSSMHFIGGIGIVVFMLVILPSLGKAQMTLSKMEISPLAQENFKFRTRKMLNINLFVYIGLNVAQIILLMVFGMSLFDAVNHAFATIATGGFSTKNASVAYYNSVPIDITITVFMFVSGIHFGLIYTTLTFKKVNFFTSPIFKYYFFATIAGITAVAVNLKYNSSYETWGESFRYAAFHVVSLSSTTGFSNTDASGWPPFAIGLVIFFTIQCACSGSTAGGLKLDRVVVFFKAVKSQVLKVQHPQAVIPVRVGKLIIADDVVNSIIIFIVLYILVLLASTLAVAAMGVDLLTGFSGAAATMANAGIGFGKVSSNFASLPDGAIAIYTFDMLLGRLEIFGLIMLFMIKSWK